MNETPIEDQYLANLCLRAFPHRQDQYITAIEFMGAWQHEMTAFTLGWRDDDSWFTEPLILRRFKSQLSWWQVDDGLKARREATVIRWLHETGLPVPRVHVTGSVRSAEPCCSSRGERRHSHTHRHAPGTADPTRACRSRYDQCGVVHTRSRRSRTRH